MTLRNMLYHPVSGKTNNLMLFVIACIPALVFFQFPLATFTNGIDPPLSWVFNYIIQGKLALGKHIIFPHGPLAFLMYPLPMGSNLWFTIIISLIARVFLAYSLLKLATRKHISIMVFAVISSFMLLAVNDLLLTLVQIIVLCYLNFFERRNITWLIPALIITPIALYIKAFVGIISLVVSLSFAGIMIYRSIIGLESRYRLLLFFIIPATFIMFWQTMYGNLHGILAYINGMTLLAVDNSAAVAVYPNNNWWAIGLGLMAGIVLLAINLKNRSLGRYAMLTGPALFAIWKYGMAREDYLHTSMMFVFILFSIVTFMIISGKFRIVNISLSVIVVMMFYFTLQKSFYFEPYKIRIDGLPTLISKGLHHRYVADTCTRSSDSAIARNKLDQSILEMIGKRTVDVYPWDYAYIAANNLNWQPRPVLQSYASYARELDQLNAQHFESKGSPEYLIWELRKITHDIHGGTLESIDGRYLLNDEPDALLSMMSCYERVASQDGIFPVMVFHKRDAKLTVHEEVTSKNQTTWNTWIEIPDATTEIQRADVSIRRNTMGSLKSFLYKDEAVYVYYKLSNDDIRIYRIVPKNASYGLWINPLILNPEDKKKGFVVKQIMFRCSNSSMMNDQIIVQWNNITFRAANSGDVVNNMHQEIVNSFFGLYEDNLKALLINHNDLEKKSEHWSNADNSKIVVSDGMHKLKLLPGEYSVSFEYSLDSLPQDYKNKGIFVRTGVWAKAVPDIKAVYVISVEKEGKPEIWKAVDINPFLLENKHLNFVTNFSILQKELLRKQGLRLRVYVWNNGTDELELGDFSVRIEAK